MKHLSRLMSVLVIVAVLMGMPALSAFAQGDNPACAGLEAADCEVLTGATAAMGTVSSFRIPAWSFTLTGTDGTDNIDISASGSGEFVMPSDPANPMDGLMVHLVIDSIEATIPGEDPVSDSAEVIVADGMTYVNYGGQWYGEELTAEDASTFGDLFSGSASGSMGLDSLGIDMTGVVTTTRGADADADGQAVQTYVTSVDVGGMLTALLSSPSFGALLGMGMGAEGADMGMGDMTPEDLQMIGAMFAPMLAGTTIEFTQGIGVDDSYIHSVALDVVLNLDISMFDPETAPISGELHFSAGVSEHNGSFTVEAPAEYSPMEELDAQGGLFGNMGM
ncbi:MAG TPA: hypothetical protein PKD09_18425 [Aggregatilinea sp.]|jgi:hypothetical protein|uniref:hypothetical protein n=1 Tax=Aggregatilinea sp. TaxID=2806333 RepID=UPI002B7A6644|nr:hypothetical protein [Aggregatilinea sp.]HML23638.1 hypothetical protein [Aggregatilinea sp.]